MKEVKELRKVSKSLISANMIDVEVCHNGSQGGDAGHGGFVNLKLTDQGGTAYGVEVRFDNYTEVNHIHHLDSGGEGFMIEQPKSITLKFMGDCERHTLIDALEFAIKELKENENVSESFESHEKDSFDDGNEYKTFEEHILDKEKNGEPLSDDEIFVLKLVKNNETKN